MQNAGHFPELVKPEDNFLAPECTAADVQLEVKGFHGSQRLLPKIPAAEGLDVQDVNSEVNAAMPHQALTAQDLEAFLAQAACSGVEDAQVPEETQAASNKDNDNSGRLLLMLLKGSRAEGGGAMPEVNDERWERSRWEPLLQPFADAKDPKRFISADSFAPGRGLCVLGSGAQPCVLKDLPESDLLVMYKPSGWATCSTPQWEGVHGNLIRYVWKKHASGPVAAPCHRLDRGTSGIVVVAKSRVALRHVCMQISGRTLVKQYIGLCRGVLDPPQGALSIPLAISSADKPLGACATSGRVAVTRYRVLGYFRHEGSGGYTDYSLVQVQIDHGRQHQIRLHMASVGHPIVCDVKYSASHLAEDSKVTGGRLFLHAAFLRGTLPPDGEEPLSIACRLPRQLRDCLTSMERVRTAEEMLSAEASELCDCLLMPDPEVIQAAPTLEEVKPMSKASSDKETDDPETEVTEETEETEGTEGTDGPEENEDAESTEKGVYDRNRLEAEMLEKMSELLHAEAEQGESSDTDSESGANQDLPEDEVEVEEGVDEIGSVAQSDSGFGPVSLHSQFVKCKVCGEQEKVERVEFPALRIRLSCRSVATWNAKVLQLFNSEEGDSGHWSAEEWHKEWSTDWWDRPKDYWGPGKWSSGRSPWVKSGLEGDPGQGKCPPSPPPPPKRDATWPSRRGEVEKRRIETQMRKELYSHLKEHGAKGVPGPSVAGLFAHRYNQFLRQDGRRNDGSVRAWISNQPGVKVEATGGNQWCVHLDPKFSW